MTKLVNLHNGKSMVFDDLMPDEEIDEIVKTMLGSDTEGAKVLILGQLAETLAAGFQMLAEQAAREHAQTVQALNGVANSLGMLDKTMRQVITSQEQAALLQSQDMAALRDAYTQRRSLVMDKDGKPIALEIGKAKAH